MTIKRYFVYLFAMLILVGFVHKDSFAMQLCGFLEVHAPSGYTITGDTKYHGASICTLNNNQVAILQQKGSTWGPDYLLTMTNSSNGNSFKVRVQQNFCSTQAGQITLGCPIANDGTCKDDYNDAADYQQNNLIAYDAAKPSSLKLYGQVFQGAHAEYGGVVCLSVKDMNLVSQVEKSKTMRVSKIRQQSVTSVASTSYSACTTGGKGEPIAISVCPEGNS